jgi:phage terminase small subunit
MPVTTTTERPSARERLSPKQDAFCLHYFETGNATEAAQLAGYSKKGLRQQGSRLLTYDDIKARLDELKARAEDSSVATVLERKQVLTEIVRGRFADFMVRGNLTNEQLKSAALQEVRVSTTQEGRTTTIKLHSPITAIAELNKMDHVYDPDGGVKIYNDNRSINVTVETDEGKTVVERLLAGEGTE